MKFQPRTTEGVWSTSEIKLQSDTTSDTIPPRLAYAQLPKGYLGLTSD